MGITRGSTICMLTCAPGIIPYLISKKYDWRKCLQLAIIFNLPRIIILSILGTFVGIIGYTLKGWVADILPEIFIPIQIFGYGVLGIFIFCFGAYMFTTSIETQEEKKQRKQKKCLKKKVVACNTKKADVDSPNQNNCESTQIHQQACSTTEPGLMNFIKSKFNKVQNRPDRLFFIWGGILSLACLGEIIVIELSVISGSFGFISANQFEAALLGGTAMFLFAVGASIPIIIVAVMSNPIGRLVRSQGKIESVRTIFGIVMILVGLWFIIMMFNFIIGLSL